MEPKMHGTNGRTTKVGTNNHGCNKTNHNGKLNKERYLQSHTNRAKIHKDNLEEQCNQDNGHQTNKWHPSNGHNIINHMCQW